MHKIMDPAASGKQDVLSILSGLGIPTFPIPRNSKRATLERFHDHATLEPDFDLRLNNVASATGHGFVVVDIDVKDGDPAAMETLSAWDCMGLPHSLRVRTPRGGLHVYLATDRPIANSRGRIAKNVDVRGHHGYVVAPGSTVDGKRYQIEGPVPQQLAPAPDWLLDLMAAPRERPQDAATPAVDLDSPDAIRRARTWLEDLAPTATEGDGGDATTLRVAMMLKDFGVSEATATDLMLDHWNEEKALPPWDEPDIRRKVANAFRYGVNPPGSRAAGAEFEAIPPDVAAGMMAGQGRGAGAAGAREAAETPAPITFAPWGIKDLRAIPRPEFLYSDFYARGYTSMTVAPPKVGKSVLTILEAVDMASGRGLLTGEAREKLRVVYYNAEDDQATIDARVAAVLGRYGVRQDEVAGSLWVVSGVAHEGFYLVSGVEPVVNEALFQELQAFIGRIGADVLIFDPLQDVSRSPETNDVFRLLGQRLRRLAAETRVALGFVHHTRKIQPGATVTVDDMRGGSALRGTSRFNRLLAPMSEEEGALSGVKDHRRFFRIAEMESNLAPPSSSANRWFEKIGIEIPNGDFCAAVVPWNWPEASDGIGTDVIGNVRAAIASMDPAPREDPRSRDWVGHAIGDVLGVDTRGDAGARERVKAIVRDWVRVDILRVEQRQDRRQGRIARFVTCGANTGVFDGL